ncbi:MAG: YicC family protein [Xanthobacteraceae bacterium]|nr:YicC family protein [Xanthobacteraceae bacterium]
MALSSMTGFARCHGGSGDYAFEWELKSVNAKGLDVRLRLPPGWDDIEPVVRKRASDVLARGTIYANLGVKRVVQASAIRVNEDILAAILRVAADLSARTGAAPPTVDGLLGIKGVIEIVEPEADEAADQAARGAVVASFDDALKGLVDMRRREGASLGDILKQRLDEIERLVARAEAAPGRRPEAVRARLAERIAALMETSDRFDPDRLSQEAVLIAAKADIREELDRIGSHVAQVRELIGKGGAVGRRLDFLAQEFNREVNTTCSKADDLELTNIGLEMKNVVEQFREQVQNLE